MTLVAFLTDTPDSVVLSQGTATSRVQIAKTGNFVDPRYGKFAIKTTDFDRWEANFAVLSTGQERAGLPVDIDHGPEKRGETEAAGWVTKLDRNGKSGKTPTPNELWATVEWNDLGVEKVSNKRYLYLSPSYQHNFRDETGKEHGTALVGIALTNRPFLTMATVSLSRSLAVEDTDDDAYSHRQMPTLIEQLRTTLNLAADADEATVLAAAASATAAAANTNAKPGDDKTLSALAQEQGMVVLSAADHLKLAADAAAGANAAKELHLSKFTTEFNDAVGKGKVMPAMEGTFQLSYDVDPEATLKALRELPEGTIPVTARGHTGDGDDDHAARVDDTVLSAAADEKWDVDTDRAALDAKVQTLMASDNIDYGDALDRVLAGV